MDATSVRDQIFANTVWNEDVEYRLDQFVDHFTLPQLVKVLEGYHGIQEESVIGSDQVLLLHAVKTTEKALVRDQHNTELRIPLNCVHKVELCPDMRATTAAGLCKFKFARVTGFLGSAAVASPGDKLEIVRVIRDAKDRTASIVVKNPRREKISPVTLPLSEVSGKLQPLMDGREYFMKELSLMKRPVFFRFIDAPKPADIPQDHSVLSPSLGVLKLDDVYSDTSVICSTKEGDTKTVFTCPKTLPITVVVAQGALDGDKEYVRLCCVFHRCVCLNKIENMESENIYASPDSIREYQYIDASVPVVPPRSPRPRGEQTARYQAPVVKPRTPRPPLQNSTPAPESGSESNVYEAIDALAVFPVPSPPKSPAAGPGTVEAAQATSTDDGPEQQVARMSLEEVSDFLKSWRLGNFVDVFYDNHVDGAILASLEAQDLADLGLNSFQSKKLLKLVSGWRPKTD